MTHLAASESQSLGEFVTGIARSCGIGHENRSDVLLIIEHVSGLDRARLLSELREPAKHMLSSHAIEEIHKLALRRSSGVPLAYLTGVKDFYGRRFRVGDGVLVPRPDTELLVETALDAYQGRASVRCLDCCTGSGCVGITFAAERSARGQATDLTLSDLSSAALAWAMSNAQKFMCSDLVRWNVQQSNLLEGIDTSTPLDLIVANPPYLTTNEAQADDVLSWTEPSIALDGGEDGLSLYAPLAMQALAALAPGGCLGVEHGFGQGNRVAELLDSCGFENIKLHADLAGRDRMVWAVKPKAGASLA